MFPRGFKTWAEHTSARVRGQLKAKPDSPLDPLQVADILNVFVLTPNDLPDLATNIRQRLVGKYSDHWSAITVSDGTYHLIVTNSAHAERRRNSDLAHELAHIILGHEPSML